MRRATAAMQRDAVATLADLSGGATFPFGDQKGMEAQMINFANELGNRYLLEFQPSSNKPGLHELKLQVPKRPELIVAARNSYWRTTPAPAATK